MGCKCICTVKVSDFPVSSRDVTNQTLPGEEKFNYFRPGRVWLATSRLGTGKWLTFFYSVWTKFELKNPQIWKCSCMILHRKTSTKMRRKLPLRVFTEIFPTPALLIVLFTESGEPIIRTLVPFSALNLITGEKQHDPGGAFAKGQPQRMTCLNLPATPHFEVRS
jgi:hypothetical protein